MNEETGYEIESNCPWECHHAVGLYIDSIRICPAQCQEDLPGDLNGNCVVDFSDFALMASDWLNSGL